MTTAAAHGEVRSALERSSLLDAVLLEHIWGHPVIVLTTGEKVVQFVSVIAGPLVLCAGYLALFRFVSGH